MSGTSRLLTASKPSKAPARGDVWLIDLKEPPRGREEGGKNRPALILSADRFNQGPAELVIAIPMSAQAKGIASHIEINPPDGGVQRRCFVKCETIRSMTKDRLIHRIGQVNERTLERVEDMVKILLSLP
jgi:mRNA interferase MazF